MIVREQTPRAMPRWALGIVVVLGVALLPLLPIPAQQSGGDEGQDETSQSLPRQGLPSSSTEQPSGGLVSMQPDRSEQIEAARDQVELIEAKVLIKRAEIEEMNLRIRQAQRNLQRLEELYRKGVLEESALNKARNEAELLPTQLPIKKAELAEVEVGLKQAMRRLSRLESNPGPSMGTGMPPPIMRPAGKGAMSGPTSGMGRPGMMSTMGGAGLPALPNPPPQDVHGTIFEADPQTGLATISLGRDSGIQKGHTLHVYRLVPNPKYLGRLEILETDARRAVGRLADATRFGPIEKGDFVSSITKGDEGLSAAARARNTNEWGNKTTGAASSGGGGMMSMMGGPGGMSASRFTRSGAADLFEEKSWDFGSVRKGERVRHEFRLTNTLDQPIHISAVRVSAAFLSAGARDAWIKPNDSVTIPVEMDTRRFAGDKTATVFVQFDQPVPAEVRLQIKAQSPDPGAATNIPAESRESKAKIIDLEQKVDQLMRQIDALHHELKQRPGKPPGEGAGPTPGPEAGDSTKP
jgi:hypothetical protein